jgi:hypothetical protein
MFGSDVVIEFASLVGFAALVTVIVNILKYFKVVQDYDAPSWVAGANMIGLIALIVYRTLICKDCDITGADSTLATLANILAYILAFIVQLGVSKIAHLAARGTPLIGTSYTLMKARAAKK